MSEPELTTEERVLRMMKRTLTDIARDTAPEPGLRHPLSQGTIQGIRECLQVITSREQELATEYGRNTGSRPRYIDEPRDEVVVPLNINTLKEGLKKDGE
ncbi:hypothetical protein DFR30_0467 [Thiogranum longum]|uniref:Segregation and condensation protein A n=1 Tax=Thiogranum longum TaxID=1537524 RepID=A0A4R1HAP4_9GAMM|nr:segregation and condensation protein A [Thiogranum longum]TCK17245.1 hypothetical protein DFR30_0467 [Thiogranum longum]